ncbi:MAG: O-antigen ligase family protein [Candidatus Improbicoccus devescovinae]|nr:MAG: O-antigen ligase family protein [Candidatus Improbicoccus devescovinae]
MDFIHIPHKIKHFFVEKFEYFRYLFCCLLLTFMLIRIINIYSLIPPIIDSIIFGFCAILGFFLVLLNFYLNKLKNQSKSLILFWIAILISSLVNIKYGIFANIKELVWCAIYFFLIYPKCENNTNLFNKVNRICSICLLIISSLSLLTFIFQTNYCFALPDITNIYLKVPYVRFGFTENRLFGLYVNPNTASKIIFLSILFIFHNFSKKKFKKNIIFNIIYITIQFFYIILSGSRGVILSSLIIIFLIFLGYIHKQHSLRSIKKNKFSTIIYSIILSLFFCIFIHLIFISIKHFCSFIPNLVNKNEISKKIEMHRIDVSESGDISNSRFKIWASAIEIFKKNLFFGTSPRNLVLYAQDVLPDSFIAKEKYLAVHNLYLGIFVYTGILGAIFFYYFLTKKAFKILNFLVEYIKKCNYINIKIFVIITIAIYACSEPEVIFTNNPDTLILWLILGEF